MTRKYKKLYNYSKFYKIEFPYKIAGAELLHLHENINITVPSAVFPI